MPASAACTAIASSSAADGSVAIAAEATSWPLDGFRLPRLNGRGGNVEEQRTAGMIRLVRIALVSAAALAAGVG